MKKKKEALLIVDMQNDFLKGGALEVPQAELILPKILSLVPLFDTVCASQDWHPHDHKSFEKNGGEWKEHCVQNTPGAEICPQIKEQKISKIFQKGDVKDKESYSVFFDEANQPASSIHSYLKEREIEALVVCGIALEYCVLATVLDGIKLGYEVYVTLDACQGLEKKAGDCQRAALEMAQKGAILCTTNKWLRK